MRKALVIVLVLIAAQLAVAGGIVTNTNQSAQFVRTLSRNASTEIDAIYFNPAGLTQLSDGWHFAFYNQSIFQEKTITNDFAFLNQSEYVGEVSAPIFPNFYATYKKEKLALSFGFGPNGGGGSADFAAGLPSFEMPVSMLPPTISSFGVPTTAYSTDINFKGTSVYYGFQFNASYAISEKFSVALGGRYIAAVNTYEGAIANIQVNPHHPLINPSGGMMSAVAFFQAAGMDQYVPLVSDKDVNVEQTASGMTPIIGLNYKPLDNLNIGLKYEFNTGLEFTNATVVDGSGMFPDGATFNYDIPAILALGAEYGFMPQLRGSLSFTTYFDKSANWDGREELLDSNSFDFGLGLEYDINDALLISAGFLHAQSGIMESYQTDISHSLSSNTLGFGLRYTLAEVWDVDLGGLFTMYDDASKSAFHGTAPVLVPYTESYSRTNIDFAIGLGYHF